MDIEYSGNHHREEVISFLKKNVFNQNWEISLPPPQSGRVPNHTLP